MYTLLTLFLISLSGIIFMVGRKLVLLRGGQIPMTQEVVFEIPHLEKVKSLTVKNIKKYGHATLVVTIRYYIRSTNFLKSQYENAKIKIKNIHIKKTSLRNVNGEERTEINKFLKIISDYKQKIREIKHKIHEEEKNS